MSRLARDAGILDRALQALMKVAAASGSAARQRGVGGRREDLSPMRMKHATGGDLEYAAKHEN
jgi:hypothetical protein